ncbi:hypothetical protein [Streptomyces aureoversilis]|uniref:Uncharacterized protein n=1 Tax=Streptomyces aureoversilis TaxID=67277 RepID=A0ABV9ZPA8_9ACTN
MGPDGLARGLPTPPRGGVDPPTATGTIPGRRPWTPGGRRLVHADHFGLTVTLLGRIVLQE